LGRSKAFGSGEMRMLRHNFPASCIAEVDACVCIGRNVNSKPVLKQRQ
jgi:hypothetical protein